MSPKKSPNGPPQDIEPSQLWSAIMTLPRAHRVVDFPRYDADGNSVGKIAMVVLNGDEIELANVNAEKEVRAAYEKTMGKIPKNDEVSLQQTVYNNRATREILFRACKDASECDPDNMGICRVVHEKQRAFFPTMQAIGKLVSSESAVLMEHYLHTQVQLGPVVKLMSQEEMDAWLELLGQGGKLDPLASLSPEDLIRLLMYSASQLYPSRTDRDSAGSQQDNSMQDD